MQRRKCSPDLQGKIRTLMPVEVTGNEVSTSGTGVRWCGIVEHEWLEGAIAVAFQNLYHALEPPSQAEGKILAAIAVVVRDRLVVWDTDFGFGDDMRGAKSAVAVADQNHGIASVQRDRHGQILDTIAGEITDIYIGPISAKGVLCDQLQGRLLREGAVAVAPQEIEPGTATCHGQILVAIAVEIPDRNFCHPDPDVHLAGLECAIPVAEHDRQVV